MTITATHEIDVNMVNLADAFCALMKEQYPLFNEKDNSNMILITEQLKQIYEGRLRGEELLGRTHKR